MKKRIFSMLLCVCMLIGMMSVPAFAAGAVKAGEKATVVTNWQVFEKPDSSSKVTGYLSAGNEVDVLEAYISGKGGIDGRWHKISYTNKMLNLSGTGYVEAMFSSSKEAFKTEHTAKMESVYVSVFVDDPVAGEKPYDDIELVNTNDMEVDDYEWSGELDGDGCFKEGVKYTLIVTVSLKNSAENKVFSSRSADHMVNRFPPTIKLSNGNRTVALTYTFTETKAPKESTAPKKENSEGIPSVQVDKFEVGDFGTMQLVSGGYSMYHEPDTRTMYGASQNTEATITVLEAGVDGVDTDAVYYAIWNEHLEEVDYVNMNDARATFGNFVKEGNDPKRPYNEEFAAKRAQDRGKFNAITEVDVDFLYATAWHKPYMADYSTEEPLTSYVNTDEYACTGVTYSTTEIPKLYSMVTATATYVAKDPYHFSEDVKSSRDKKTKAVFFNDKSSLITNTFSINYIDEKNIELVYHEYIERVDHAVFSNAPTQAMKDYNERHQYQRGNAMPVIGTSKLNNHILPVGAYLWHYPIDYTKAFEIQPGQIIEIIDWDLTDEIPDITGDWCRVKIGSGMGFVPQAYLTEVVMTDYWQGAPATNHDSPYVFAGGSGTKEDPYLIETAEQLDAIRKNSAKYFKLIKDIDLSNWGNWIPIGGTPAYGGNGDDVNNKAQFGANAFRGQLDGNGHVISGMTIKINEEKPFMQEKSNDRYFGLMGYMSNGLGNSDAGIRNLGLINFNIDVTYSAYSESLYIWAGAFATHMLDSTITNCYTANGKINFNINKAPEVDMNTINTQFMFGGLASEIAGCTITKCFNDADITVKSNDKDNFYLIAGGLAADIQKAKISECYNSGDITLPLTDWANGYNSVACGLFVYAEKYGDIKAVEHSTVTDCYNAGNLTANVVAGFANYGRTNCNCAFTNCYNVGKLTIDEGINVMGLPGKADLIYLPDATFTTSNCYANGTSVSGSAWRHSDKLGRKVLASIPEDSFVLPNVDAVAIAPKAEVVGNFTDVPVSAWYAEPVKWAVDKKITTGTSATTFSPDTTCTKAQIITFIWRAMGEPNYTTSYNPFTDVNYKDYYFVPSWWAYEKGMVEKGKFEADKFVTRADTVVYLWKMSGSPDVGVTNTFTDVPADAPYAKAVAWAVKNGITSGTSETTFSPNDTCTRAHIVTFLQRAVQ
ncbi:MAG: S-layer homology domain-containing protein [Clostridia bacterium]|nr:S-layer homology domain-containing protein [Clostridia bacterium]